MDKTLSLGCNAFGDNSRVDWEFYNSRGFRTLPFIWLPFGSIGVGKNGGARNPPPPAASLGEVTCLFLPRSCPHPHGLLLVLELTTLVLFA